jgi:hypothetical protein
MRNAKKGFVILAAMALMALMAPMWPEPAVAKIQCKGNFQVTKHGLIATPYCEEEQIARVARSYGWNGTASEVHNNPNTKVYLCQRFGRDNRLKGSCGAYGEVPWVPGR